jgi:hypothetical protein
MLVLWPETYLSEGNASSGCSDSGAVFWRPARLSRSRALRAAPFALTGVVDTLDFNIYAVTESSSGVTI